MRFAAYVNGDYVDLASAVVSVEDRGYQFADGVYEVTRFDGRQPVRLDAHLDRLITSVAGLRIAGAPDHAEWRRIIRRLMDECELPDDKSHRTILYQQVTRGSAPRNHLFPPEGTTKPGVVAYFRMCPAYTEEQRENGVALLSQVDERWNRCWIKSLLLLPAVLAKQAAREAGAFEALLVRRGIVTEGSATNAFCVRGGTVWTHPGGPCVLPGVTRMALLEAAENLGIPVREEGVTLEDFAAADEAFLTSTTMSVMPVTTLDGRPIGTGRVGDVTRRLAAEVQRLLERS
ncbi:MAG: D-amino acid aminotransferase [Candidatus Sumerlaeaceae bacterium]|nr:D-amino acid aminotransferase [Candidatus Sumerlaeaceae bacterium]